jgi:syntaxin 16
MASRNLTKAFCQARNGGKANRSLLNNINPILNTDSDQNSDSGLLNADGELVNWKASRDGENLPPLWVDTLDRIDETMARIQLGIRELAALHTKRLLVNFEQDEDEQERQIGRKTSDITAFFRDVEALLKKIGKQGDENRISEGEKTVRKNMQSTIAMKLQKLSSEFRSSQKQYMLKVQAQKSGAGNAAFDYLDDNKSQSKGNRSGYSGVSTNSADGIIGPDSGFNSAQIQVVEDMEEEVNARDAEIANIAKSIEELAQIFKELAVLVIDQGTILDRIDYNMESAVEHAKEGVEELVKAEEHQKSATPLKCIAVLVLGIIILLAILIHRWSTKNNN